jgi:hypothetical protein
MAPPNPVGLGSCTRNFDVGSKLKDRGFITLEGDFLSVGCRLKPLFSQNSESPTKEEDHDI